jgi:hypothetical protein
MDELTGTGAGARVVCAIATAVLNAAIAEKMNFNFILSNDSFIDVHFWVH